MEKFEEFWAGIWEDNTKTAQQKCMTAVSKKTGHKVTNVQEFMITEKKLYKTAKKQKNCYRNRRSTKFSEKSLEVYTAQN